MLVMNDTIKQNVQWFPGHMAKTRRKIKESLPLVDAVVEILDARIPRSSQNPEIAEIIGGKPHIAILNMRLQKNGLNIFGKTVYMLWHLIVKLVRA